VMRSKCSFNFENCTGSYPRDPLGRRTGYAYVWSSLPRLATNTRIGAARRIVPWTIFSIPAHSLLTSRISCQVTCSP